MNLEAKSVLDGKSGSINGGLFPMGPPPSEATSGSC